MKLVGKYLNNGHMAHEDGRVGRNSEGPSGRNIWLIFKSFQFTAPVVNLCQLEALLLVIGQSNPIPGIVVTSVKAHRRSAKNTFYFLTNQSLGFILFNQSILRISGTWNMQGPSPAPQQEHTHAQAGCRHRQSLGSPENYVVVSLLLSMIYHMMIYHMFTHLDSPLEEFDGIFMLLLVRKAVSTSAPLDKQWADTQKTDWLNLLLSSFQGVFDDFDQIPCSSGELVQTYKVLC